MVWALMLISIASAGGVRETVEFIEGYIDYLLYSYLIPLLLFATILAILVYSIAQLFGAEIGARGREWAKGVLISIIIAAVSLIILSLMTSPSLRLAIRAGAEETFIREEVLKPAEQIMFSLIMLLVILSALIYAGGQMLDAAGRAKASTWANNLIIAVITASVLYVVLFQLISDVGMRIFRGSIIEQYGGTLITAIAVISIFIILVYLITKALNLKEWEAYLSIELSNLHLSFIMLILIVAMFGFMNAFLSALLGTTQISKTAAQQLESTQKSLVESIVDIQVIQGCLSFFDNFMKRFGDAGLTRQKKIFPGLGFLSTAFNFLVMGLIAAFGSISLQIIFLKFVDSLLFNLLLPAGLILRFFPPTRDAGSFLIAFSFGIGIIFPSIYIFNRLAIEEVFGISTSEPLFKKPYFLTLSMCAAPKLWIYGAAANLVDKALDLPIIRYIRPIAEILLRIGVNELTVNFLLIGDFLELLQVFSLLSVPAIFSPAFAMMFTVAFINALSKFILLRV